MALPRSGILLAEDDQIDAKAFRRAMARLGVTAPLTVARDGVEAWALLEGPAALRPTIIVLDVNMPRMNGLELLERIRTSVTLNDTPVFMLTTSDSSADRSSAIARDVQGYIVKSELADSLAAALQIALPSR